jgi:hypothetical protein
MPNKGDRDNSYVSFLRQNNKIELLEEYKGAKLKHKMKCLVCDHQWAATPVSKKQTFRKNRVSGCPNCNDKRKVKRKNLYQQRNIQVLKTRGIEILSNFTGLHTTITKLKFINHNCGHTFETYPGNVINRGTDCIICGKQKRMEPLTKWSKENSKRWRETASEWQKYKATVGALTRQTYKIYKKQINPLNLFRGKAGVEGAHHLDHVVPIRFCFENDIPPKICADSSNLQMLGWRDNVGSRCHIKGNIPPNFLPYLNEQSVYNHFVNLLHNQFPNSKKFEVIYGITTTLYDDFSNTAIVLIPISKPFANQKTANNAAKIFEQHNIRYFMIFEDEINDNYNLIINKLNHYLNTNSSPRIHARKCIIKEIDKKLKGEFLNRFHIQGNDNSQLSYGAFYEDNLIGVMTFTKPRVALGYKSKDRKTYDGIWELSRFVTDINYRIPGMASKLLKHFERSKNPQKIISYADRRWSIGNLYHQLNFTLDIKNPPNYFYIMDNQRKHRWNYRKDILKNTLSTYNPNDTEYENMQNNGFWRVWDCGTYRFSKIYK